MLDRRIMLGPSALAEQGSKQFVLRMYNSISSVAKPLLTLYGLPRKWKARNTLRHVERILKQNASPQTQRAESSFADLQTAFQPYPEYGYDPLSTWKRGVDRCFELLQVFNHGATKLDYP